MSNLALLIGAKPKKDKIGPTVRIESGVYTAQLENLKDSIIMLCNSSGTVDKLSHGVELQLAGGDYFTHITTPGQEIFINATLVRVR